MRLRLLALSLLCLSLVSNKARAEGDTNVQAQPNALVILVLSTRI